MKKKYVVIFSVLIILLVVIYICIPKTKKEVEDKPKTNVNTNGFLTLMLEQDDGTYQKSTSNSWPTGNYAFNSELSGCERGGELVYDRETNIVKLISSGSDKCYVYFDKYNVAKITNVTNTKTTNSVTLTVTTEAGENPIDKYYFSKDNGNSYQESTSNTYTFNNLNYGTAYTFKVYAKDTLGYETNEETVQVTTNAYVNPVVNNITVTDTTNDSISIRVSASGGTNSVATYYYSINNGAYSSSSSNTKTFTGLSKGTTYTIKVYVTDTNGVSSNVQTTSAETENTVLLADYIKGLYTSQGSNGIYYHTSSLANSAADNSYRYSGANPNNYVCFGSDASTCPNDNLYRIIGVFDDEVKLIKSTSYGSSKIWSDSPAQWNTASLRNYLNTTYLNSLGYYSNLISTHDWKYGIVEASVYMTFREMHLQEQSFTNTVFAKIGLMYVGDFYYTLNPEYWSDYIFYKWYDSDLFWPGDGWTMTNLMSEAFAFFVDCSAYNFFQMEDPFFLVNNEAQYVYPVFYLNSNITYDSGSGTSSDPIRIN